ncbi:MAG TPA: hypothetical protein VGE93_16635 [Bryobacteraceae bacterium]
MPCPRFEPVTLVSDPQHANARLPLIDEYDGICHAGPEAIDAPAALRFRSCNHGNSAGVCQHFPAGETRSSFRYSVVSHEGHTLTVVCIEEQNYAPVRWHNIEYSVATGQIQTPLQDPSLRAQALAFCQSYLRRFPL